MTRRIVIEMKNQGTDLATGDLVRVSLPRSKRPAGSPPFGELGTVVALAARLRTPDGMAPVGIGERSSDQDHPSWRAALAYERDKHFARQAEQDRQYQERSVRRAVEEKLGYRLRDGAAAVDIAVAPPAYGPRTVIEVRRKDNGRAYAGVGVNFVFALTDLLDSVR